MSHPTPDNKPTQIGKYRIVELIGEGAMGVVYRAVDSVLDRTVAIKVMSASIARQADLRQRFLREAQAAGSLQHPNVVTIFDLGEVDGHLFIAMEFVHGVDLERLIELHEPLSLQAKLDIVVDVLTGLSYAHKRGIVHRDIKPANIRVGEDGRAKIMDFGVAHLASSSMTRTGLVVGTPSYMAPEQVTGGKTTPATDIFAVGAVLYQLLTGSKPFDAPTLQSLFYKIVSEMPPSLSEPFPGLPPALNRIVMKALAKDPLERYQSALDMASEVGRVRSEMSGAPYPASLSLSQTIATAIESEKPTQQSARGIKLAGGVAAAIAASLLLWFTLARDPSPAVGASSNAAPVTSARLDDTVAAQVASTAGSTAVPRVPIAPVKGSVPPPQNVVESPATGVPVAPARPAVTRRDAARNAQVNRAKAEPRPDPRIAIREAQAARRAAAAAAAAAARTPPAAPRLRVAEPSVQPPIAGPADREVRPAAPVVPVAPRPVVSEPAASPPPKPSAPSTGDIGPVVAAYARAIESRDIGAVRRAYPGITGDQQRGFEQFFQSARSINVTFRVVNAEASGSSADARLVGSYEYVTTSGKTERQPVSFAATLRHDGNTWRLTSVR